LPAIAALCALFLLVMPAPAQSLAPSLARPLGLSPGAAASGQRPNILLIVGDDLGVDLVGAYGEHPSPANTPVINSLSAGGVLFRNVWSDPVCSPSRATLLTGRHCFRTGFGWGTDYFTSATELPLSEFTIAEALGPSYRTAAVGKWHLGSLKVSGELHPNLQGFEHFRGTMAVFPSFIGNEYYSWDKVIDGAHSVSTTYVTTEVVNDALDVINSFGNDPWFLWVAFQAPHAPFHKPPSNLHTYNLPANIATSIPIHIKAAVEAMDAEIGRLLDTLGPTVLANTIVIFVGDNGTDKNGSTPPFNPKKAKGTIYEGGINVPLIVRGPGVAVGQECAALAGTTDLFATIAELGGVAPVTAEDSVSFAPLLANPSLPGMRTSVYSEMFFPNGAGPYSTRLRAVRDARYKLIYTYSASTIPGKVEFYDLQADPFETNNLLTGMLTAQELAAHASLTALLHEPYVAWLPTAAPVAGTNGPPMLTGAGVLKPGETGAVTLAQARANALAALVIGTRNTGVFFKGGVLVPSLDLVLFTKLPASGALALPFTWPAGIPAGFSILFQYWIKDPGAIQGWASTNGLAATPE